MSEKDKYHASIFPMELSTRIFSHNLSVKEIEEILINNNEKIEIIYGDYVTTFVLRKNAAILLDNSSWLNLEDTKINGTPKICIFNIKQKSNNNLIVIISGYSSVTNGFFNLLTSILGLNYSDVKLNLYEIIKRSSGILEVQYQDIRNGKIVIESFTNPLSPEEFNSRISEKLKIIDDLLSVSLLFDNISMKLTNDGKVSISQININEKQLSVILDSLFAEKS